MNATRTGFTLLEVLLASVFLSLLVSTVFVVVHGARQTASGVRRQLKAAEQARRALDLMARDLASASALGPAAGFTASPRRGARPGRDFLSFVTARTVHATGPSTGPDLVFVSYSLEASHGPDKTLELFRRMVPVARGSTPGEPPALAGPAAGSQGRQASLIASFGARYSDGRTWRDDWLGRAGLPSAVELELETSTGPGAQPFGCSTTVWLPCAGGTR